MASSPHTNAPATPQVAARSCHCLPAASGCQAAQHSTARHSAHLGEQLPGPGDGLALEVVAKAPVAHHLEKGVVVVVLAHIIQVVVLAAGADALRQGEDAGAGGEQRQGGVWWRGEKGQGMRKGITSLHPCHRSRGYACTERLSTLRHFQSD